ncbi:hypothetical protein DV736_g19, partial [Chaetothyriales sp. CBS 134916]
MIPSSISSSCLQSDYLAYSWSQQRNDPTMDHRHMDHGDMDHGDMDMGGDKCSMNMLFTWSSKNLCIVFSQWHVTGTLSLILSLLAIVALTAGYEWVRSVSRKYEQRLSARLQAFAAPSTSNSLADGSSSLLTAGKDARLAVERRGVIIKAALYALQIFYSFFIMSGCLLPAV